MDDLAQKLLLAVIAFLLGLVAEAIKRAFQRDRRRLSYSVVKEPLIAVTQELPERVLQRIPQQSQFNVTKFCIIGENSGTTSLSGLSLLVVANAEAEVLEQSVVTIPPRGVKYSTPTQSKSNEFAIEQLDLDRQQSVKAELFVKSEKAPDVAVYWSGGGGVDWISGGSPSALGMEEHLVAIVRNYILAEFAPSLLTGLGYLLAGLLSSYIDASVQTQYITMGGVGLGTTIGALIRFYFYLRMVPHLVAIFREFTRIRSRPPLIGSVQHTTSQGTQFNAPIDATLSAEKQPR
jgi:hypothetical protein